MSRGDINRLMRMLLDIVNKCTVSDDGGTGPELSICLKHMRCTAGVRGNTQVLQLHVTSEVANIKNSGHNSL